MASNEIIVRIVVDCAAFTIGFITTILACKFALARSAAAHRREVEELRECLKEAVDYRCSLCKCKGKACEFDGFCAEQKWRKALKGVK